MTIGEHASTFYGKPIEDYVPGTPPRALATHVYRIAAEYDEEPGLLGRLNAFLDEVDTQQVEALVLGCWEEAYDQSVQGALNGLIARKDELPTLKALFVGDVTYEECEISWLQQGNYGGILQAFPRLEVLRVRGGTNLEIPAFEHPNLRELIIECGGLPASVLQDLAKTTLPALKHLELWLGTEDYGFDATPADVYAAVEALQPARLDYLGLRNSDITDILAEWLADKSWVANLDTLDLSLGTLTDDGADALLKNPAIAAPGGRLATLDLSHHFLTVEMRERLAALPRRVVLDDPQDDEEGSYYYVAVGE